MMMDEREIEDEKTLVEKKISPLSTYRFSPSCLSMKLRSVTFVYLSSALPSSESSLYRPGACL